MKMNPTTVLGGIVALVFIVAALVIGVLAFDHGSIDAQSTPIIVMVIGLVAPTVTSLLALLKAENVKSDVASVKEDINNGVVKNKVKEAIRETNAESDATAQRSYVEPIPLADNPKPTRRPRKTTTHKTTKGKAE